jgi:hypothetical protein
MRVATDSAIRVAQPHGQLGDERVAGLVAEAVVHQLEVVDVDHHHRDGVVGTTGARDRQVQVLLEHRAVRQTGEMVVVRDERRVLLGLARVGHVEHDAVDERRRAVGRSDGRRAVAEPDDVAVLRDQPVLVRERLAGLASTDVLLQRPFSVLGMQVPGPQVRVGGVLLGRDPEEGLDLGTDVGRRHRVVDDVDVDDRGDLFDQRAVSSDDGSELPFGPPEIRGDPLERVPDVLRELARAGQERCHGVGRGRRTARGRGEVVLGFQRRGTAFDWSLLVIGHHTWIP